MREPHQHDGKGIACKHVLQGERKVNYVCNNPDGTWDIMCGESDHDSIDGAAVICLGCAFSAYIPDLSPDEIPIGYVADRPNAGARWVIRPMTGEEIGEEE